MLKTLVGIRFIDTSVVSHLQDESVVTIVNPIIIVDAYLVSRS